MCGNRDSSSEREKLEKFARRLQAALQLQSILKALEKLS